MDTMTDEPHNDPKHLLLDLRSYDSETDSHSHNYHQLVLPIQGTLNLEIGSQGDVLEKQQAAIIAAGKSHGFSGSAENCFVVADIPPTLAPELERLPAFITLSPALASYVLFLNLQLQSSNAHTCNQATQRQMLLLLIQLLFEQVGAPINLDRRLTAARHYLEKNYAQKITLERVANQSGISTRQLRDLFRRDLGMTPQQYLIEIRMQKAWRLLEAGQLSVQQAADAVGYNNLAAFSDRFRKHFDIPPSYFRRSPKL